MNSLLTTVAYGAVHPDRPPPVLPGIDVLRTATIDRLRHGAGDADRQVRRGRLPRTGFTNTSMALRCRDYADAGLVDKANDMWASWRDFADAVDLHFEGIEWIRDDDLEGEPA